MVLRIRRRPEPRAGTIALAALVLALLGVAPAQAQLSVSLTTSLPSGEPVGTSVGWSASISNAGPSPVYRFSVQFPGGAPRIVRDFSGSRSLLWTTLQETTVQVNVTVFDATGASATAAAPFDFTSRVTGGAPVVSATPHPLVALYSVPPCAAGRVAVSFRPAAGGTWQATPSQACQPGKSLNFYVAGLQPSTAYIMVYQQNDNGTITTGPPLDFRTGNPPFNPPALTVTKPPDASTSVADGVLLMTTLASSAAAQIGPLATDLTGNLLWYDLNLSSPSMVGAYMARPAPGGTMLSVVFGQQRLWETDLAGNLVRETNVPRVNQQLAATARDTINRFSHEALRLPNGHTLVLGAVEKLLTDVQGPGTVDVLGDMVIDLDANFQVAWSWNAFDWLDAARRAPLNETCSASPPDCGPLRLATVANDWTHGNDIFLLPDGNLIVSLRNQDWVVKIDYRMGTGQVIWRLGVAGDFILSSTDPWPWFSHQHNAQFHNGRLELYDNGNTRVSQTGPGNSRGQVLALDEAAMAASLVLNADLGAYSPAFGSARVLSNGNYQFLSGCLGCGSGGPHSSQAVEVLPSGAASYSISAPLTVYRAFRMKDLYSYVP